MSNVVDFKARKAKGKSKKYEPVTMEMVQQWVDEDIKKLMEATGKSYEEAVKIAKDFCKKYPFLIEYITNSR